MLAALNDAAASTLVHEYRHGPDALAQLNAAVDQHLAPWGVSPRDHYSLALVLEEWVTNVVRHGYRQRSAASVLIRLDVGRDFLTVTFEDAAEPFDPWSQPPTVRALSLDTVQPGGLGLAMIRDVASQLGYERIKDRNHVMVQLARESGP